MTNIIPGYRELTNFKYWRILQMEDLFRPNQEQLRKMQLLDPLAEIEPAALLFWCMQHSNQLIYRV